MGYRNLSECAFDLEKKGMLVRVDAELDPHLEIGCVQRRVYEAGGPALLFANVRGSRFPMLGNLFGTTERTRYIFRDSLRVIEAMVKMKISPKEAAADFPSLLKAIAGAYRLLPSGKRFSPVLKNICTLKDLPQLVSWPMDGGAFVTLPLVYTENPASRGFRSSNLGMYRVQISGNEYLENEAGLHYQIHRGIGVHHREALRRGEPLPVNIFIGGAPALTVAAVMPLPEGMPELAFAGVLGGRRIGYGRTPNGLPVPSEADFCISGHIYGNETKPEGPFGDHIGYYSLRHDFPVMKVDAVYHRDNAVYPFTSVGRPPQEDTSFGEFIHELTGGLIPEVLPGVKAVHAVDAAGVHPLLFAVGSERYAPYEDNPRPKELLTQANAVLGQGQLSLAKYLFISNYFDNEELDINDAEAFLVHMLERADWRRDLHFQTSTTIDTLDYSGSGLNEGSKLVIAACGEKRRELPTEIKNGLNLPDGFSEPRVAMPGVLVIKGTKADAPRGMEDERMHAFVRRFDAEHPINRFPLIIIADDSEFTARNLSNLLWVSFTRSNPASDVYGIEAETVSKHFGCRGSLVIDARIKPHHAPALEMDKDVQKRVDSLFAKGGVLAGLG
ncbi:UbiD family decarboxylase [Geovibrio thiophilus]|uniref:UbiD family decarboxylase n=1 Tax=Geovibrio thiophilus TaxID=139438 RepID=A0A410K0V2_9BACT|nr:UbiD family decarboxylase [Geovibrio thiophilus]QAR33965.1 UbiD family decarboxylase [Geovibrio thiophilus]